VLEGQHKKSTCMRVGRRRPLLVKGTDDLTSQFQLMISCPEETQLIFREAVQLKRSGSMVEGMLVCKQKIDKMHSSDPLMVFAEERIHTENHLWIIVGNVQQR